MGKRKKTEVKNVDFDNTKEEIKENETILENTEIKQEEPKQQEIKQEEPLLLSKDDIIGVYWLGTGIYKGYFNNFIESINNFFPKKKLILKIISDGLDEYEGYHTDHILDTNIIHIPDMPYPLVTLLKLQWISWNMKDDRFYYFWYFDSDTVFIKKDDDIWDMIFDIQKNIDIMNSQCYEIYCQRTEEDIINHINIVSVYKNPNFQIDCSLPENWEYNKNFKYINFSVFGTNTDFMKIFALKVLDIMKYDLETLDYSLEPSKNYRIIGWASEETIVNKLSFDNTLNHNYKEFVSQLYVGPQENINNINLALTFCYQKYMQDFKSKTKNANFVNIYDIEKILAK